MSDYEKLMLEMMIHIIQQQDRLIDMGIDVTGNKLIRRAWSMHANKDYL